MSRDCRGLDQKSDCITCCGIIDESYHDRTVHRMVEADLRLGGPMDLTISGFQPPLVPLSILCLL